MTISFTLNGRAVYPNYSQGLSLVSARESDQRFSRTTLSEALVFVGQDYDWITAQPFDTKFLLHMEAGSFAWGGVFYKTDCKFDADGKTCEVTPDPYDYYKAVLDGMDKEFDLVKLKPASVTCGMKKRDIVQLYVISDGVGDTIITNAAGGSTWEQDIAVARDEVTDAKLVNDWHFSLQRSIFAYQMGEGSYRGMYYGTKYTTLTTTVLTFKGKIYDLKIWMERVGGSTGYAYFFRRAMYDKDGTQIASTFAETNYGTTASIPFQETVTIKDGTVATARSADIYARFLTSEDNPTAADRPSDDIIEYNLNYPKVYNGQLGPDLDVTFVISTFTSTAPTEWGRNSYGYYFIRPNPVNNINYIPFARSTWSPFSLWVWGGPILDIWYYPYTLNDAYPIESAINVLLEELTGNTDKPVTFDIADSLFLSGQSPLRSGRKLLIAQLTNVKKTYYQNAAQTGKITLKQIFDMLKNCFHAYWHIDPEGGLHIEHILWYINGGSYSSVARTPDADLTQMVNPRTYHTWDFGQNSFTFEKVSLPERVEFSYASSQTLPFNGLPIQYISGYVRKGQTERVNVSNFYADVDWLISGASGTGDEGWVAIDADDDNGVYSCPTALLTNDEDKYQPQNAYMAFLYLENTYFAYDMSAPDAEFQGGYPVNCESTIKARTQEVTFPLSVALPDYALVRTGIGTGEVDTIEYELLSGSATAELKLPTEDE